MKKKLITQHDIERMNLKDNSVFYVEKHMLLSPGAKECLRKKEIKIEYGKNLSPKVHKENELTERIRKILLENYKIDDEHIVKIIMQKIKN